MIGVGRILYLNPANMDDSRPDSNEESGLRKPIKQCWIKTRHIERFKPSPD